MFDVSKVLDSGNDNFYIDIHIIRPFPPACIVRDDLGNPKTCMYGGKKRARIPSASIKYDMRKAFEKRWGKSAVGIRTKLVKEIIAKKIVSIDSTISAETAEKLIDDMLVGKKKLISKDTLFFISNKQVESIAKVLADYYVNNREIIEAAEKEEEKKAGEEKKPKKKKDDPLSDEKKACVKALIDALRKNPAIDMLFLGRMAAEDPSLGYEACVQVAQAISVHEVIEEFDYFTASDDCTGDDEHGAGHIGVTPFNASTVYEYASINVIEMLEQFVEYYEEYESDLAAYAVATFVNEFIDAIPKGMSKRNAHTTLPEAVYVLINTGSPINLAGAFEKPIKADRDGGYSEPAIKRLAEYAKRQFVENNKQPYREWAIGTDEFGAGIRTDRKTMLQEMGEEVLKKQSEMEK